MIAWSFVNFTIKAYDCGENFDKGVEYTGYGLFKRGIRKNQGFCWKQEGGLCDKCKLPVPLNNNALVFDYINSVATDWTLVAMGNSRHLEPVADGSGMLVCKGSPSRWQHIHGVKDQRPEYDDGKFPDPVAVAIWNFMQTLDNKEIKD